MVGIATATIAVSAYTYMAGWQAARLANIGGAHLLVPLNTQVCIAAGLSLIYATILAACCFPIWLLMGMRNLVSCWTASALGFVATALFWIMINLPGQSGIWDLIVGSFPYAMSGAVAGLATWATRPTGSVYDC